MENNNLKQVIPFLNKNNSEAIIVIAIGEDKLPEVSVLKEMPKEMLSAILQFVLNKIEEHKVDHIDVLLPSAGQQGVQDLPKIKW